MNKNIDLTELLKDCPKGTKLYSRSIGTVTFDCIKSDRICIKNHKGIETAYTKSAKYCYAEEDAEIDLFPSKDQRDWSKWHRPFVEGDILVSEIGNIVLCSHVDEKQLVHYHCLLNPYGILKICNDVGVGYSYNCNLANDFQKQRLFNALKKEGYEWDAEKKELKTLQSFKDGDIVATNDGLVPNKFDPKTLQPFDKVLVRQYDVSTWGIDFYSYYDEAEDYVVCTGDVHYNYCIPFNDDTKHLVGKSNDAPEFYRYWKCK